MSNIENKDELHESELIRRDTPLKDYSDEQLMEELKARLKILYHTEGHDQLLEKIYDLLRTSGKKQLDFGECLFGLSNTDLEMLANDLIGFREVIVGNEATPEDPHYYEWGNALMSLGVMQGAVLEEYSARMNKLIKACQKSREA